MRHRWGVAVACAVLAVPATPAPARAVPTATLDDGVLTVSAGPGDEDLYVRVLEFGADGPFQPVTEVDLEPAADLAGCEHDPASPSPGLWYCEGYPRQVRLDGGSGTATFDVITHGTIATRVVVHGGAAGTRAVVSGVTGGTTRFRGDRSTDVVTSARPGRLVADLAGGDDAIDVIHVGTRATIGLGPGDDLLTVAVPYGTEPAASDRVSALGGPGDDTFRSGSVPVVLAGGPGDDWFLPDTDSAAVLAGWGQPVAATPGDVVRGGPGRDTVELARPGSTDRLRITLGGGADDGAPRERDEYVGIEDVVVHFVAGVVVGGPTGNHLTLLAGGTSRGRGGDDVLDGGTRIFAGPGVDVVVADPHTRLVDVRDGERDLVRCTSPTTRVRADPRDLVKGPCVAGRRPS